MGRALPTAGSPPGTALMVLVVTGSCSSGLGALTLAKPPSAYSTLVWMPQYSGAPASREVKVIASIGSFASSAPMASVSFLGSSTRTPSREGTDWAWKS